MQAKDDIFKTTNFDVVNVRLELVKIGCIYSGHFIGISTEHLSGYCNIDPLLPNVLLVSKLIQQLVQAFVDDDVEVVASPAIGAIPLCHWGAHFLMQSTGQDVKGVWADKVTGSAEREFIFEREGFAEAIKGKKVLILEDMINRMKSIKAIIKTVTEAGGIVIGVGGIAANRGVSAEVLGVPKFVKLCSVEYETWPSQKCATDGLCAQAVPIVVDIGHGDDFKKLNPDYKGGYVRLLKQKI